MGLVLLAGGLAAALLGTRLGRIYLTPVAWTGIVLVADGLLDRAGRSWIRNRPGRLAAVALVSVPSWLLFEWYDRPRFWSPDGPELWWHYHGLPPWPERGLGYAWSFATITPAILLLAFLLRPAALRLVGRGVGGRLPAEVGWAVAAVGAVLAAIPLLWPSEYFAADVWLAWVLLLDPVNRARGRPSLIVLLERGERALPAALLAAGLAAGILWESLNWVAGARWTYTVPFLGDVKLFEMPLLGFLGFAPFALECFTIWAALVGRWEDLEGVVV